MPLINSIKESLGYIQDTDAEKNSIKFEKGSFERTEKRSLFRNFWSWFIHLISCSRVPRNKKLDDVTQEILRQINEVQELTDEECDLVNKSFTKLALIIDKNGGDHLQLVKNKAAEMLNRTASKMAEVATQTLQINIENEPSSDPILHSDSNEEQNSLKEDQHNSSDDNSTDVKGGNKEPQPEQQNQKQQAEEKTSQSDILIDLSDTITKDVQKPKDDSKTSEIFDFFSLTSLSPTLPFIESKNNIEIKQPDSIEELTSQAKLLLFESDKKRQEEGAKAIVDRMTKYSDQEIFKNLSVNKKTASLLFPHFDEDAKSKILARQIWEVLRNNNLNFDEFFEQAQKETSDVWKEAGEILAGMQKKSGKKIDFEKFKQSGLFQLSPSLAVALLDGFSARQSTNYGQLLFNYYFSEDVLEETQKQFLENVDIDFFKRYINPIPSNEEENIIWHRFIAALEKCEQSDHILSIIHCVAGLAQEKDKEELLKDLPPSIILLLPVDVYTKTHPHLGLKAILESNKLYEPESQELIKNLWQTIKSSENSEELINNVLEMLKDISEDDFKYIIDRLIEDAKIEDASYFAALVKLLKAQNKDKFSEYILSFIFEENLSEEIRLEFISQFPALALTQYAIPRFEQAEKYNKIYFNIFSKLDIEEATHVGNSRMLSNWEKIIASYKEDETLPLQNLLPLVISYQKVVDICFLVLVAKFNNDKLKSQQEKDALNAQASSSKHGGRVKLKFMPETSEGDESYYAIFTHLEKEPWKALMLINSDIPEFNGNNKDKLCKEFYKHITTWLENQVDSENKLLFPICLQIFQKVAPPEKENSVTAKAKNFGGTNKGNSQNISQEKILETIVPITSSELSAFFKQESLNVLKKINALNSLNKTIQTCLLYNLRHVSSEELAEDLIYVHPYQLLVGLTDDVSRMNIISAIKLGLKNNHSNQEKIVEFMNILAANDLIVGGLISESAIQELKKHDKIFSGLHDKYANMDGVLEALKSINDPFKKIAMKLIVYATLFSLQPTAVTRDQGLNFLNELQK